MLDLLMLDDNTFLVDAGIHIPGTRLTLEDKETIIQAAIQHFCIYAIKAELDDIAKGLDTFHLIQLFKNHPKAFYPALAWTKPPMKTANSMEDLFSIQFSPTG